MDPFLGEIRLFPYSYAPTGWAACDGTVLQINQYQALFALIGTSFGGDGRTTFAMPDLRGKAPLSSPGAYYVAMQGAFPQRN
jgi:microcystin-dependent protein